MGSDPEPYSVEVLPAKVRKRREFVGGTLFLIGAAALGLAYLGYHGWNSKAELTRVSAEAQRSERSLEQAKEVDRKTRELVEANETLAASASLLQGVAGSGEQLARALAAVHSGLPEGFWITDLASEWGIAEGLRVVRGQERPIVRMEGSAREGTDLISELYQMFLAKLRTDLPGAELEANLSPSGDRFTLELCLLAPPPPPPPEPEAPR
jgi:hypothetical protein